MRCLPVFNHMLNQQVAQNLPLMNGADLCRRLPSWHTFGAHDLAPTSGGGCAARRPSRIEEEQAVTGCESQANHMYMLVSVPPLIADATNSSSARFRRRGIVVAPNQRHPGTILKEVTDFNLSVKIPRAAKDLFPA